MFLNRLTRLKGLGRYACLGTAVLETLGRKYKMHNLQKGRIDYQLGALANKSLFCRPEVATRYLERDYIAPTVTQQAVICPEFKPELIFIDSFSELTDQIFRHKQDGWQFCCNYLDARHDDEFAENFECLGLLNLDRLQESYSEMLKLIELRWPQIPIVYIHFPYALEPRPQFVERALEIKRVVEICAAVHPNLYSFSVPSSVVKPPLIVEPGMASFPYHYSQETYDAFADMIRRHTVLGRYF